MTHAPLAESQAAIAAGSQSFATAARLMPKGVREDTVMLYAWCRHADDVVDGQALGSAPVGGDGAARLDALRTESLAALRTDAPVSPPFAALRAVARRHDFPEAWPMALIEGFAMDVAGLHCGTLDDTLRYSWHVAGVVGVMMARVMGVRDDAVLDRACDLGLAFQLTNIARDVMDDARIGRIYLPGAWLDGARPEGKLPSPEVYAAILRLLDAAEPYYVSARHGLPDLPFRAAWSIAAALRIYRAIGTRIRAGGPAAYHLRISTTKAEKAALLAAAFGDAARSRRAGSPPPRTGLWTRPR